MKKVLFILALFICSIGFSATVPKPVIRTAQQDAELKIWIIGIQKLAQDAESKADAAEKEAADSRVQLDKANSSLIEANSNADSLQKAIDAQTNALNKAIEDKNLAEAHDAKTTKENALLKTILGIEAALVVVFILLWLKIPNLSPPWGLVATCAAPLIVFGLVKILL